MLFRSVSGFFPAFLGNVRELVVVEALPVRILPHGHSHNVLFPLELHAVGKVVPSGIHFLGDVEFPWVRGNPFARADLGGAELVHLVRSAVVGSYRKGGRADDSAVLGWEGAGF